MIRNLALYLLCLSTLSVSGDYARADYAPKVGSPHPHFVLPRIDNREPVSLAHYRGKKILLVHFASW